HPERMIETWLVDSWVEHMRQNRRITRADRAVEERVRRLAREPVRITHYIAARPRVSSHQ
ncbi:MAG: MFS transporter, partial [Sinobacteraceae bacterium]|nr:MFS transporter [Nevskiaceae bacterium]